MLKGTSWGVSKDPLLCIYRALIRPIIEYGMEIYFNSSDSTLKQIEKIRSCFSYVINTDYADFTLLFTDGSESQHGTSSAFFAPQTNTKRLIAINSLDQLSLPSFMLFYLLYIG